MVRGIAFVLIAGLMHAAAARAASLINCKISSAIPYRAELSGSGDGRSLTVVFRQRPTVASANEIVRACMQVAIKRDLAHELLGTTWIGEAQFSLAPGKAFLAYSPKEGTVRPFGIDDAVKALKAK